MLRLGRTYENGWYDTEINLEEALKWYQLAADQDYDGAQECVDRVESALQNAAEDSWQKNSTDLLPVRQPLIVLK